MFRSNFLVVLLCALLSTGVSLALNYYSKAVTHLWLPGLIFLVLLTLIANGYYFIKRGTGSFTGLLISGIVTRFLLSLIFLLVMWLLFRSDYLSIAVHFLAHYALFTLGEIRYLSRLAARKRQRGFHDNPQIK